MSHLDTKSLARKTPKTPKFPLVSVILPTYNAADFVAEAITSVLAQTYRHFELIIVDDCSTDATWSIVSRFARQNPQKIKAFRLKQNRNQGGDGAGSEAFRRISPKSQFIARMDADDRCLPQRLAVQVRYLQNHPQVAVVGSSAVVINQFGEVTGAKLVSGTAQQIYRSFFKANPMIHPTVMVRREALLHPKTLYRLDLNANNDYLTFAEMVSKGLRLVNLAQPLIEYRVHTTNDSIKNLKRTLFNTITIRSRMVREFGYRPTLVSWLVFAVQVVGLSWWPEAWLRTAYLLARGMMTPQSVFASLRSTVQKLQISQ